MKLLLTEHTEKLIEQGRATSAAQLEGQEEPDHMPVVKLFTPDANCTWLISELDPDDPDLAFGLCDLGFGCPELGSVRISEIEGLRGAFGLPPERDRHFRPQRSLSAYADLARANGRIVA
ncbi:Protein of unknown function [Lutimaribacter pacificus]|uniref:Uncharacterized protein n=1 Tax=Lutimaribacter pacificus TaxID=391948 RepID=A0A1H0NZM6_9RHOB|nr:DUF2958 domain-containing protein [Lutimaribacter pacificus]SDO98237.1 Protein of unknown function [Lutimaribacter pacificus]SHK97435.1 Protein of unknown function [Lutimaribacter pacificus]